MVAIDSMWLVIGAFLQQTSLVLLTSGNIIPITNGDKTLNVSTTCQKEVFMKTHVQNGKLLSKKDYETLRECAQYYPECKKKVGTLSITYAEDSTGKTFIIFETTDIDKQGCWGYVLQSTTSLDRKSIYFNFDEEDKDFTELIYFYLGVEYNFTVTPLPSGPSFSIVTFAPTRCELEVIENIYYKLKNKPDLFANCKTPGYNARQSVAAKICERYPQNTAKRYMTVQTLVVQENCEFVLLAENTIDVSTQ